MKVSLSSQDKIRNNFVYHIRQELFTECKELHDSQGSKLCSTCWSFLDLIYSVDKAIKNIYVHDVYKKLEAQKIKGDDE